MSVHEDLQNAWNIYLKESEKADLKGNKSAATRARKALLEISKLCKERRKELVPQGEADEE